MMAWTINRTATLAWSNLVPYIVSLTADFWYFNGTRSSIHTQLSYRRGKRSFPVVRGRIVDSSEVRKGVSVGVNASICRTPSCAKWKACPSRALNIPANYNDIRIVRDGFSRVTPDGDTAYTYSDISDVYAERLCDAVISLLYFPPVRGISLFATCQLERVPQETRGQWRVDGFRIQVRSFGINLFGRTVSATPTRPAILSTLWDSMLFYAFIYR